jgi:hypothetical protein
MNFFLIWLVIFATLDPDPDCESGTGTPFYLNPNPQHCLKLWVLSSLFMLQTVLVQKSLKTTCNDLFWIRIHPCGWKSYL